MFIHTYVGLDLGRFKGGHNELAHRDAAIALG
jgi:hypothetical protein